MLGKVCESRDGGGVDMLTKAKSQNPQAASFLEKYGAATVLLLGLIFYFLLILQYIRLSPYAHIPILDAKSYWQLALEVAHNGRPLSSLTHSAPLYPLFLIVCVYLFGPNIYAVYVIQLSLALITVLLIHQLWQQLFSPLHGFIAALLSLFYLPFVYYITKLLPEILAILILTGFLAIYTHRRLLDKPGGLILLGLVAGLAIMVRSQFIAVILPLLALLPFYRKPDPVTKLSRWRVPIVLACLILTLLPLGLYNYHHTGGFYVTAPNGGITFYEGNNPEATGTYSSVPGISDDVNLQLKDMVEVASSHFGRPVTVWEADRHFWHKGLNYIKNNPVDWLKLELRKIVLLLNPKETFTIYDIYLERSKYLPFLLFFPISWGIFLPLSLIGIFDIIFIKKEPIKNILPLIIVGIALLGLLLVFFVLDRYRLLLLPVVAGFAAHGVIALSKAWSKRHLPLAVAGSGVLLVGIAVTVMIKKPIAPGAWSNLGSILVRLERFSEAEDSLHQALQTDPTNPIVINNMIAALLYQDKVEEALPFIETLHSYPLFAQKAAKYRQFIAEKGYPLSP
jgi:4-amino-4-deoxy-L-arabinose transferase-like glycosyltransferase